MRCDILFVRESKKKTPNGTENEKQQMHINEIKEKQTPSQHSNIQQTVSPGQVTHTQLKERCPKVISKCGLKLNHKIQK